MVIRLVPADAFEQFCLDLGVLSLRFLGFADLDGYHAAFLLHVTALEHRSKSSLTTDTFDLVTIVELLSGVGPVGTVILG